MSKKLKSGIIGQAQVIFGGAIGMTLGTVKDAGEKAFAVGMAELKHPTAKAGDPINDEETYNGIQVSLVFPNFDALNNFRNILDQLEVDLKERIAQEEAQQKIDFDDTDPNHLVHEHIDEPDPKAKRIEDCNLSVRTTNICKAGGIDTLGDLCKLHKTDWLKFRNGGKKSLIEIDDLLHDHGLDWAEWR